MMDNKDVKEDVKEVGNKQGLFYQAIHLAKIPMLISLVLTPVRFLLEYAGLPDYAIFIIGLLWLTLTFAVYWGIKLYQKRQAYLLLMLSLILFSPVSRLTVVAAWWVDRKWELGTHYGDFFDSWAQVLLNQGVYGSLVQIIPGVLLGSLTIFVMRKRNPVQD